MADADTIYALASAPGRAGLVVVRVSGTRARVAAERLAGSLPEDRVAGLRVIRDPGGEVLDQGIVLVFAQGASFTGEDVVEFHLHGSIAVAGAVLAALGREPGLRLAEPGEFTRRALEDGRLDLAQVEGLADLIDAETAAQRRQALAVMRGALSDKVAIWRRDLIRATALLEATMDFADEEVPVDVTPEVRALLVASRETMQRELAGGAAAERIRDGFEVAILGRPNVGKSTLLNALAGRDAAITSEVEGTTRDVIEVRMDIRGLPATLLDTAGMRQAIDKVEKIGIERAKTRAEKADLRVYLLSGDERPDDLGVALREGDIVAQSKADLGGAGKALKDRLAVSGLTGVGLDTLLDQIATVLSARAAGASSAIRARHQAALTDAVSGLDRAEIHVLSGAGDSDLAAEELRRVLRSLDVMIGRVDVENILDVIFASFCIGK